MTVFDAYAIIAGLTMEPAADEVESVFRAAPKRYVTAIGLAEVYDRVQRRGGSLAGVRRGVGLLIAGGLEVVAVGQPEGEQAGTLRANHYHRTRRPVSIADCVAAAVADRLGEALATPDPHLTAMAREEGIQVVALPDSAGRRT